ncbi:MAG: hypothetical protein NTX25_19335 [Proteobacteria bacterium]|nr:hypothetical protein [Pseudomonadota bacterium]
MYFIGELMNSGPTLFQAENLQALPHLAELARQLWSPVSARSQLPQLPTNFDLAEKLRFLREQKIGRLTL